MNPTVILISLKSLVEKDKEFRHSLDSGGVRQNVNLETTQCLIIMKDVEE